MQVSKQELSMIPNPNLSIVLPGDCNANCSFCFWRKEQSKKKSKECNSTRYMHRLKKHLAKLPENFYQISLTGAEPTMSPVFQQVLEAIQPYRSKFTKIVLTTNGTGLPHHQNTWNRKIDHINISRHHASQLLSDKIFGSKQLTENQITAMCNYANEFGIDVTLNCVLTSAIANQGDIHKFIIFAKSVNASAVCFRKQLGNLKPSRLEAELRHDYKVVSETSCPVCRSTKQILSGMPVVWKAGLDEPSDAQGSIFELIIQPDGKLTSDWNGKHEITIGATIQEVDEDDEDVDDEDISARKMPSSRSLRGQQPVEALLKTSLIRAVESLNSAVRLLSQNEIVAIEDDDDEDELRPVPKKKVIKKKKVKKLSSRNNSILGSCGSGAGGCGSYSSGGSCGSPATGSC